MVDHDDAIKSLTCFFCFLMVATRINKGSWPFVCVSAEVVKLWVCRVLALERVENFILTKGLNILALLSSRNSLVYILCQSCVHINLT